MFSKNDGDREIPQVDFEVLTFEDLYPEPVNLTIVVILDSPDYKVSLLRFD